MALIRFRRKLQRQYIYIWRNWYIPSEYTYVTVKLKFEIYTTEAVCDRFFSETTERNFLKHSSYYGHNM